MHALSHSARRSRRRPTHAVLSSSSPPRAACRWVGNAKMAASWYCARLGFEEIAYRGLETGSRDVATHVVRQGSIVFAFSSPLHGGAGSSSAACAEMNAHLSAHGDGVKDVAFAVSDCRAVYASALARGGASVAAPHEASDASGSVVLATVRTYGDTVHTFVQRGGYGGAFLPGYRAVAGGGDPAAGARGLGGAVGLERVDHVVGNMPDLGMLPAVEWYERVLSFHRFWSVDDKQMSTEHSALRSIVVADFSERVKMPINEPAAAKRKSQIQEYCDYYAGAGVQHIAMATRDIVTAIARLRGRGVDFLRVPGTYYEDLRKRLAGAPFAVKEDLDTLQRLNILLDMDEKGYLLQIFTAPLQDRPTLFLEVIQREGCEGFGAGNFKSLFEAIEREQVRARRDRGARARAAHCRSPSRFSRTGSPPAPALPPAE